ncbi:Fe-S oxidoreductase [Paralcaligenes ureilyticus]|uniref:Fe-S oxidoreductase n=2 Tax=Paralcaligenes ureilyticus TaxID=627131 RepID=A0A4R3MBH2_9BURK|nr:(Fe-S)-binding protein [Paralcaligenes ureilyticus]TCT10921.1 Fe-S oxidoreductase [Paralcaligenes ureilyticus]
MMHSLAAVISVLFWIGVMGLAVGIGRRAALWRTGRAAAVKWQGLLAIPKRYFVDLHHVVARDPYMARTHIATAGGAILALLLVGVNYGLALYSQSLDIAIALAALIMFTGVVFVAYRRAKNRPSRLSGGAWNRLPWMLGTLALGLLLLGLPAPGVQTATAFSYVISLLTVLLLVAGAWELTLGAGRGGPMKHAMAGLAHLAFHPRVERFEKSPSTSPTALKPLNLDDAELGVGKPSDFRWNQLLSFDACVQCGKCEEACPAFAAEQPLNPKKLIQDIVVGMSGTTDAHYAGSPYPGMPVGQHHCTTGEFIFPNLLDPQTLWACTTCRACVQACPMLIEHVDAIVDMRRHQTLTLGEIPGKGPEVIANLRETGTMGGYDLGARYNWAVDLNVKTAKETEAVDVLLIAGEGAYDMRYQRSLRALVKVLQAAKVDFAVLGKLETDTGDVARRLGDEATFQMLAHQLIATLNTLSFSKIVTADPHVMHCLRNEYPAFGGKFTVMHHTTFMAELIDTGAIRPKPLEIDHTLTYHDPCYLARYNGEIEAPRRVLKTLGISITEMERHGVNGRCCGGGGGAPITDIPGKKRIPDIRIQDARDINAGTVAVACPGCTAMLEGVVGPRPDVRDIAELVASALEQS